MKTDLDLNVAAPEDLPKVLRYAADCYYESRGDLSAAWQDMEAGRIWLKLAKLLEATAVKAEEIIRKGL
jgi:hypothetical protein